MQNQLRAKIAIRGAVQGVGFRPFVYRLATQMNLPGWIRNTSAGVFIELEGSKTDLETFLRQLEIEKPTHSFIQSVEVSYLDLFGFNKFEIRESESSGAASALILPDIATCSACISEIFDVTNRRYFYPFTNCTHCGPRFSIIESLPYDRANTSMKKFAMCSKCQEEYDNPLDRRFHAQPNACSECGPQLEFWNRDGKVVDQSFVALTKATEAIRSGKIVAIKGLGGFHLIVDATNENAVSRLRERKQREEKPFALMYPNIMAVRDDCPVSPMEERLLEGPSSPIVLLQKNTNLRISGNVAPGNPYLGAMLPYTPLHHLLMSLVEHPVVATSGNLSDEPICIEEHEALARLHNIADFFLVHNRPIVRHMDDSIVRIVMDRELILRRARGYAPLPVQIPDPGNSKNPLLAVGGHLKNTVAISKGPDVFISQHIGDLETKEAYEAFTKVIRDLENLYQCKAAEIVCDLHPDYISTQFAKALSGHTISIQHHYAHVASCMAENELDGKLLGVSWDGTGYGLDATIWGGEFLTTNEETFDHAASFRKFRLPGGSAAMKEPRRSAIGLLYEVFAEKTFDLPLPVFASFRSSELSVISQMLTKSIQSPLTSSAGRLFDAVASLLNLRQFSNFEGQAAMELEFAAMKADGGQQPYDFWIKPASDSLLIVDWTPMVWEILDDIKTNANLNAVAARFHNTLTEVIIKVAKRINQERVVLSGGCFQNKYLTERTIQRLQAEGFRPYWHQRVPPNDGGLSLGQIYAAHRAATYQQRKQRPLIQEKESSCV
jgi:hydrogenase maturation protein HypF